MLAELIMAFLLARRIFFPNFLMMASISGAKRMMNSVSFQLMTSATPNAIAAFIGS